MPVRTLMVLAGCLGISGDLSKMIFPVAASMIIALLADNPSSIPESRCMDLLVFLEILTLEGECLCLTAI